MAPALIVQGFSSFPARALEGTGRAGFKKPGGVEVETEFYAGRRGYLHGGLGIITPLDERQKIGRRSASLGTSVAEKPAAETILSTYERHS